MDSCQLQFELNKLRLQADALKDLMYEAELKFALENQRSLPVANRPKSVRLKFDGQMLHFSQAFELSHETLTGLAKRFDLHKCSAQEESEPDTLPRNGCTSNGPEEGLSC